MFTKGQKFSKEHKRRMSENHVGMLGKHHSEKTRELLSLQKIGKHLSDEHKKKISKKSTLNNALKDPQRKEEIIGRMKKTRLENLLKKEQPYKGKYFTDSFQEEKCIDYLYDRGVTNFSFQKQIGNKFHDFVFDDKKIVWEHHPYVPHYHKETTEEYYKQRRENLDENGYSDYKLVVTTNLKEIKEVAVI